MQCSKSGFRVLGSGFSETRFCFSPNTGKPIKGNKRILLCFLYNLWLCPFPKSIFLVFCIIMILVFYQCKCNCVWSLVRVFVCFLPVPIILKRCEIMILSKLWLKLKLLKRKNTMEENPTPEAEIKVLARGVFSFYFFTFLPVLSSSCFKKTPPG